MHTLYSIMSLRCNVNVLIQKEMYMDAGWKCNKKTEFDEIVILYDKIRPEYPEEIFEDIFHYSRFEKSKKALEIGAGTGKATSPFLNAGYDVTAVEIGVNMSEFLSNKFNEYKNFNIITTSFEDVLLEDESYDLIYSATAFHWVDSKIGCPKAFRLLKSGGTFALFRYTTVPSCGKALYEEIQAVYEKYFIKPYKRPVRKLFDEYKESSEIKRGFGFEDLKTYGFRDVTTLLYHAYKVFTAQEYIALLDTFTDHRNLPEVDRAALYTGIEEAIRRNSGQHKVDYVFQLCMGRKL